jgi:hypothetical protein
VDDLRGTPALERTLNHRVDYQPSAVLAPKESFTLPVPAINRGMARYRMLEAGGYTIRFRYVPEWETPGLVSAQAGLVSSAPATLTITQAAPQAVREGRGLVALHLQRSGDELIASLESTHDLPVSVNLGLGSPWNMYRAHLLWSAALAAQDPVAFPVEPGGRPDPQRLRVLAPGERAELARLSVDQLRDRLGGSVQQVSVSYMNLLDRRLLERSVPPGTDPQELQNLLERLPTPTFTGKVHSETVSLPPAQGQK